MRREEGKTFAITNTCAANALGIVKPEHYSYGSGESARRAIEPLAQHLGISVEEVARRVLDKATDKIIPVIETLVSEYELDRDQVVLVGGGGGAAALIRHTARRLSLDYRISQNAEVISSIGVALAMVRDVVERVIINPAPEDIAAIKQEARDGAMRAGANPDSIEVFVEINPQTNRIRCTALGTTEMRTQDMSHTINEEEGRAIAAQSMGLPPERVERRADTGLVHVFQGLVEEKRLWLFTARRHPVRVLDNHGFVKVQRSDGSVFQLSGSNALEGLKQAWENLTIYNGDSILFPNLFLIVGSHIVDFSGLQSVDHVLGLAASELEGIKAEEPVVVVGSRAPRGM